MNIQGYYSLYKNKSQIFVAQMNIYFIFLIERVQSKFVIIVNEKFVKFIFNNAVFNYEEQMIF